MTRSTRASLAGRLIGCGLVTIALAATLAALTPVAATATTITPTTLHTAASTDVFGKGPLVVSNSQAAQAAAALASTNPAGAAAASTIAKYAVATWLGQWTQGATLTKLLSAQLTASKAAGTTPVFVVYGIPDRDCGGYSAGGFTASTYSAWTDQIAAALAGQRVAVVVEPDALAQLSGACSGDTAGREALLLHEMKAFGAAGVAAYLDAGNSNWIAPSVMAQRLIASGIAYGRGFSSNVSNYLTTAAEVAYDQKVSALTNGAHYVIDTSRNGRGSDGEWCNAAGAGLGAVPRVVSDGTALDALLWVKTPGASDGTCNGGPDAGTWFPSYAQALVANAVLAVPAASASSTPVTPVTPAAPAGPATPAVTAGITATTITGSVRVPAGTTITSPSGQYRLTFQLDGNLVEYGNGRALWSSKTSGNSGAALALQADGNAVVYSASGRALWNSSTSRVGAATTLSVTDLGDVTVGAGSTVAWQNAAPGADTLTPAVTLTARQQIVDRTGAQQLILQPDGNLVLYKHGRAAWSSKTDHYPGSTARLQADGNFVVYDVTGRARWASGTDHVGAAGLRLVMQTDGNVVAYGNGRAVWSTRTS